MDDSNLTNSSYSWVGGTQNVQGINENGAVNAAILGKESLRCEKERPVDFTFSGMSSYAPLKVVSL